ncbi:hypothetical protein CIK76_14920 [Glutamicibacter sp. BW80]|nr:hypothetical protein CIK76_14920 [Glutamicibacter sp. BW80]
MTTRELLPAIRAEAGGVKSREFFSSTRPGVVWSLVWILRCTHLGEAITMLRSLSPSFEAIAGHPSPHPMTGDYHRATNLDMRKAKTAGAIRAAGTPPIRRRNS